MLLDTHVLFWSAFDGGRLGPACRQRIEQAAREANLAVSALSFWELAMLQAKRKIDFGGDVAVWRTELLDGGLVEIPVDGAIAVRAGLLSGLHGDPADRIIVATAQDGHQLVTVDDRILRWGGSLDRIDARE